MSLRTRIRRLEGNRTGETFDPVILPRQEDHGSRHFGYAITTVGQIAQTEDETGAEFTKRALDAAPRGHAIEDMSEAELDSALTAIGDAILSFQHLGWANDEDETAELQERLSRQKRDVREQNQLAHFKPYPKQLEFYANSLDNRERLLMAANQVGKTYCGAMEAAIHLTGRYPEWWPGYRYDRPIEMWAGSDTSETTRDTVQRNLVGPPADRSKWGTAAIPANAILDVASRQGVSDAIDTVLVRHASGGASILGFKSYDQKRPKWQGTKKDLIWLDEEPPEDIYFEALTRTNAVEDGRLYLTFTPLKGMSDVVLRFLGDQV